MARHTLLTDFLSELEVPHTSEYSDRVYRNMPFKSLFGLAYALKSYNIESTGYKCDKPADVMTLTPPFMARTSAGTFVIITKISDNTVEYLYNSKHQSSPRDEFQARLDGTVFMAFPTDKSREPDLGRHEFVSFITRCRNLALALGPLALVILGGDIHRRIHRRRHHPCVPAEYYRHPHECAAHQENLARGFIYCRPSMWRGSTWRM